MIDKQSYFTVLPNKYSFVSVNIRNIQRLGIKMFRFYNGLSPPLMNNIFKLKAENPYYIRHVSQFSRSMAKSGCHGTGSISYLGLKRWDIQPQKPKNIGNLEYFKKETETWKPGNFPCSLCTLYIESVGFL